MKSKIKSNYRQNPNRAAGIQSQKVKVERTKTETNTKINVETRYSASHQ